MGLDHLRDWEVSQELMVHQVLKLAMEILGNMEHMGVRDLQDLQ